MEELIKRIKSEDGTDLIPAVAADDQMEDGQVMKDSLESSENKRPLVLYLYKILFGERKSMGPSETQFRVGLVQQLEKILKRDFSSTKELRESVEDYLQGVDGRRSPVHIRIRRARKWLGITQGELGKRLEYKNHAAIAQFEAGKRFPPKRVLDWLVETEMLQKKAG